MGHARRVKTSPQAGGAGSRVEECVTVLWLGQGKECRGHFATQFGTNVLVHVEMLHVLDQLKGHSLTNVNQTIHALC